MALLKDRVASQLHALANASGMAQSRQELGAGLLRPQAEIPPKYFYNLLGSKLFEAICQLDEYYLTRSEAAIFEMYQPEIAASAGAGVTLIDLGAGNCEKAARLFGVLRPRQYVPVDISEDFLNVAVATLQRKYPDLSILPLGLDFSEGLSLPPQVRQERRLFFYPGSSLGNFTQLQALQFLKRIRQACIGQDGAVLIGVDLVKGSAQMEAAYDDALGVTAAFNRNILLHVNAILGADFKLRDWHHQAIFNTGQSRIEMHLVAQSDLAVNWPGGTRRFAAGETIHTENSYKYTKSRFLELLGQAGFAEARSWTDRNNAFLVCHAKAI
jgi:dimethylhistidine N-methyltransferase